eukprot:CAMPEP_0174273094 /NCGR_PEP_ID=MMETSP0439-20130205/53382_1 /TAXON_ID=0 /ORGANISM="Stereomyxa ramosa, Strain Chinc5" /LENGTH=588 /DNA_ID=CAMNT_0015364029 /DNA_START=204 /DNA_END=1967 /DNA_ORIENTATION=+
MALNQPADTYQTKRFYELTSDSSFSSSSFSSSSSGDEEIFLDETDPLIVNEAGSMEHATPLTPPSLYSASNAKSSTHGKVKRYRVDKEKKKKGGVFDLLKSLWNQPGKVWILPVYYFFTQLACAWFIVQAIAYLPGSKYKSSLKYIAYSIFCVDAFLDNSILIFLCWKKITTFNTVVTTFASLFISVMYMVYVIAVPLDDDCDWCGIHFPTSYISFPYLVSGVIYFLIAFLARVRPFGITFIRPAAEVWGLFIGFPYFIVAVSILSLWQLHWDGGYCILLAAVFWYTCGWFLAIYFTFTRDSKFCLLNNRIPKLTDPNHTNPAYESAAMSCTLRDLLNDPLIHIIPPSELKVHERVGLGGFGEVYRGSWCGTTIAIKKLLCFSRLDEEKVLEDFLSEVKILSKLRHPNILLLLGVCIDNNNQALITEFMPGGTLYDLIHNPKKRHRKQKIVYGLPLITTILLQIAQGICYLHHLHPPLIHRDLKPQNILLDNALTVKISDFGISTIHKVSQTMTRVGTTQWAAPEILRGNKYTEKVDVYSYGIILWECVTRRVPYDNIDNAVAVVTKVAIEGIRPPLPDEDNELCPGW